MMTGQAKNAASYGNIVGHLLVLRDEVRETNLEEAAAIERIVSDIMALQIRDGYLSRASWAASRS